MLLSAIDSVPRAPGVQLLPLVKQVIAANDGPRDQHEIRRIYDYYRRYASGLRSTIATVI
jgi:hypothetical protein